MRRPVWLAFALLLLPAPALAAQPRCPLPLDSCIVRFGLMRERPYLGVYLHVDSLGRRIVDSTLAGAPAARAGLRPGDVLEAVDGVPAERFFLAGKAGWKTGDTLRATIVRGGRERAVPVAAEHIPEDLLARIVGEHMLEGHLAWMDTGGQPGGGLR